jgi:hypothetical protein
MSVFAKFNNMSGRSGGQSAGKLGGVVGDRQIVIYGCSTAQHIADRTADDIHAFFLGKGIRINWKHHDCNALYPMKISKKTSEIT